MREGTNEWTYTTTKHITTLLLRSRIKRGVRQGDPLSTLLFNTTLEESFKYLNWGNKGLNINGVKITNLRFADDNVLISETRKGLEAMLRELNTAGRETWLTINSDKSKILTKSTKLAQSIKICHENQEIETVTDTIYLGQPISLDNRWEKEVTSRITLAWRKYWSLKHIFQGNFSNDQRYEIFNMCVAPVLTYVSPTWTLNFKSTKKKKRILRCDQYWE